MKIPHIPPNYIELYGIFGEFEVPNGKYLIKYFSTLANNRHSGSDYHKLLKELKPMRERTNPEKIDDLGSLLQRDLSDYRVATELIPYLMNTRYNNADEKHVAFFPAVVCVLMPKGFINKEPNSTYPKPVLSDDGLNINYGDWICEHFPDENGNITPLGKLKIDLEKSHIIVLDGQHRANAFRIIANSFDDSGRNSIYANFYTDIAKPDQLKADLPTTIVWFESSSEEVEVQPDLISRRLFIDVNQSAKIINQSRFVLLNDREPSSILTRFFYSHVAKNHFACDVFSLIHSGFDFDENLRSRVTPHALTLTVPEMISYVFDWMLFGKRTYNSLSVYKVGQERERKELENFDYYFGTGENAKYIELYVDLDENTKKGVKGNINLDDFESVFIEKFGKYYYELFTGFPLVGSHIQATAKIEEDRNEFRGEFASPTVQDTWDRLFKGGEGLYYVFNRLGEKKGKGREITNAAYRIEELFVAERAEKFSGYTEGVVNRAYDTFRTIAFQVGYVMAFDKFFRDSDFIEIEEAVEEFILRLSEVEASEWVCILTDFKDALVKEVDPKTWPSFKNLILRIIQHENEFYNLDENSYDSPDMVIVKNSFISKCKNYTADNLRQQLKDTYISEIPEEVVSSFIENAKAELVGLYSKVDGLEILDLDYNQECRESLEQICLEDE